MNPRQRRGLLALLVAVGLAVLTLTSLHRYTADVARDVGDKRDVLVLKRAVEPFATVQQDDVEVRRVPRRWSAPDVLDAPGQLLGRVASTRLDRGTYLDQGDLTSPPAASSGEREVSVVADVAASVAGAVRPQDRVDVIAVVAGRGQERPTARVVAGGIRILRVAPMNGDDLVPGRPGATATPSPGATPAPDEGQGGQDVGGGRRADVTSLAVTVAVSPKQAADLVLADASAEALRLALLPRAGAPTGLGGA